MKDRKKKGATRDKNAKITQVMNNGGPDEEEDEDSDGSRKKP